MAARRRRSCPSCAGPLRRGSGERALYRAGAHVGLGVVCPRCVARSVRVVLGVLAAPLEKTTPKKRRGVFVRSVLGD